MFSERSGVVDIGLEGKMPLRSIRSRCSRCSVPVHHLGAIAGRHGGCPLLSWMHGLACVSHKGDQVVSGVAINIIAAGMTVVLGIAWFAQGGQTPPVSTEVTDQALFPGLQEALAQVPFIGRVVGEGLLSHNALVYLALALVPVSWWVLFRTRFGLRLRAVGENPQMVDAAGSSVTGLRYAALTINGVLCGLAVVTRVG